MPDSSRCSTDQPILPAAQAATGHAQGATRLLEAMADGLLGLDDSGLIHYANPAAAALLGVPAADLLGQCAHHLLHGAEPQTRPCGPECPLRALGSLRAPLAGECALPRANGRRLPIEYTLTPIHEEGQFTGAVLSLRDISRRNARDRAKDEFISTVSHELRTPLTSIRGALGLLSSGILGAISDKAANLLRIALTNSDRLVRLINDILDLERIQSGREPLSFRAVQLGEIVRQAIDGIHPMAEEAHVRLAHDAERAEILGDPDRLMQVVTNLLSNAVKFSPRRSTVTVTLQPGVTGVTLSVIDEGRGIPDDKLEMIFGRFQQVDATDARQKGGTGLGLAICRSIVLQHSGRIWAEQNPGQGSTFRVYLPYQPSVALTAHEDEEQIGRGAVVLADANSLTRPVIAAQLARHGYRVVETLTPEQTLAAARAGVDAILLDTSVDGLNGWEILPMLRQSAPEDKTPVILLCVDHAAHTRETAQADGKVSKPPQEEELLSELARVLSAPGEKTRVLVVEDDLDLAGVIREVFAQEAIEVALAHTRKEALEACFSFAPNLIVLDIGLPDGDGFLLVEWLRQHEALACLPLVVYSGRELSAAERRQLTLGPTHFLSKARVQPQQLEALVLTLLRSARRAEDTQAC